MTVWLKRSNIRIVTAMLAALNVLAVLAMWLGSQQGLDYDGRPIGTDFIAFWSAGWLALHDTIALANGTLRFSQIHPLVPLGQEQILLWHYPPPFLLLVAPLALLPYVPALLGFIAVSLAAAAAALRTLTTDRLGWLIWLGAPATLLSLLTGQTGLLIAAIAGAGLALRATSPYAAGFILGALIIKPHFLLLIPVFLLLQRDLKTMVGMAAGCVFWVLLSVLAFGLEPWRFFLENAASARTILETGAPPWEKMGSAFVTAKLLGAGTPLAWVIHKLVVLLALALAWKALQRRDAMAPAALLLFTLVLTPYQFDYDLVLLLPAIAFWVQANRGQWMKGEQALILLLWLGPILTVPLAMQTNLGLMPVLLLAALALISKRANTAAPA